MASEETNETRSSTGHILVTGGAGFIGSHLVDSLLARKEKVVVLDDLSTGTLDNLPLEHPELTVIEGKISECEDLESVVRHSKAIYHLAAAVGVELVLRSPVRTLHTNLYETESVLQQASRHQVPLLLTSTSEVYGRSNKPVLSESDELILGPPTVGRWSYACSKLMDEFLALAYAKEQGLPVVIARLFNTVGPRQTGRYGMVLPRFIDAAQRGAPLEVHGDGTQTRCFCHVKDTVDALIKLQESPASHGEIFNIGSTEEISIEDLARLVIEVLGSHSPIQFVPYEKAYPAGFEDMPRRHPNTEKLFRTIGCRPSIPMRAIIESTR